MRLPSIGRLFRKKSQIAPKREVPNATKAIVFVHGLGSNAAKTWTKFIELMRSDSAFSEWDISFYEYPTEKVRLPGMPDALGILELSEGLKTELSVRHSGKQVTLVGHSLGGLVVRQYLTSEVDAGRSPAASHAMFYAVPNTGAEMARYGTLFSANNRQVESLRSGDEVLRRLNADWNRLDVDKVVKTHYITAGIDGVVSSMSSRPTSPNSGHDFIPFCNHTNIVLPDNERDLRYAILKQFVLGINADGNALENHKSSQFVGLNPDPLFDIYTPANEPYYITRDVDTAVAEVLSSGHGWLHGPSGTGKTAALIRCVSKFDWKLAHIMLASYQDQTPRGLLRALCIEFADLCGTGDSPPDGAEVSELILFFRRQARCFPENVICVAIEEIPLNEKCQLVAFVDTMLLLTQALNADPGTTRRVILAFTALDEPSASGEERLRERIVPIPFDLWTSGELGGLASRIFPYVRPTLTANELDEICAAAHGSPRFIKRVFMRWRSGSAKDYELSDLLLSVRAEFVS